MKIDLQNIDAAFNVENKLQAVVVSGHGYIIANDGAIVNSTVLDMYDDVSAEDYLSAFLTRHMYNNSINHALYALYNN